jgi:hypothetical protein
VKLREHQKILKTDLEAKINAWMIAPGFAPDNSATVLGAKMCTNSN